MPENQKEWKHCHDCGLEAIDDCVSANKHIPDDENFAPCVYCVRNRLDHKPTNWRADFHDEMWIRESDCSPTIQDVGPHEQSLLRTLHIILTEGSEKVAENQS
jgi:hypothetical protein